MKMLKLSVLLGTVLSVAGCFQTATTDTRQSNTGIASRRYVQADRRTTSGRTNSDYATASAQTIRAGEDNSNFLLGNPSRAGRDFNNYLLERPQHAMSYNKANGGPNWVSWHLNENDLGDIRRGDFLPDPLLPADMQIRPSDYRNSGYDRDLHPRKNPIYK